MNENPFEQSTLHSHSTSSPGLSTPIAGGDSVEVRYPAMVRTIVPIAILASAFMAPAIVFFVLQPPLSYAIAAALAITELATAGFLWFLFNSSFVRADANGITKSQMGQTKTVRWEEIGDVEMREIGSNSPRTDYILKDEQGRIVMQFNDLGNSEHGERLRDYIASQREDS